MPALKLASIVAKNYLHIHPKLDEPNPSTLAFADLKHYIIALGKILPAYFKAVNPADAELLSVASVTEKFRVMIRVLLEVLEANDGETFYGSIPEQLWEIMRKSLDFELGAGAIGATIRNEAMLGDVTQRMLYHVCYAASAYLMLIQ